MGRRLPLWGAWVIAGCATGTSSAPAPVATSPSAAWATVPASIWEGVYTPQQADRGQELALLSCVMCHTANQWRSPGFLRLWQGRRVGDLYERMRATMPQDEPGRLQAQDYADIIAYMLSLHSVPTGSAGRELPSDLAVLDAIYITAAPAQGN